MKKANRKRRLSALLAGLFVVSLLFGLKPFRVQSANRVIKWSEINAAYEKYGDEYQFARADHFYVMGPGDLFINDSGKRASIYFKDWEFEIIEPGATWIFDTKNAPQTYYGVDELPWVITSTHPEGMNGLGFCDVTSVNDKWFLEGGTFILENAINYQEPLAIDETKVRQFITRAYKEILGRNPDTAGMNYWLGEMKAQRMGGGQMCAQFLASKEFQNRNYDSAKKVEICYRVFFNRDANADASGKKYWTDLLDNGVSESYIARGMAGSTEFKNICTDYGITQGTVALNENRDKNARVTAFAARCYKESLGRAGDKGGLNYWTGEILAKRITPAKAAEGFVFSKEMNNKGYNNSQFIQMLYRLCMGRAYDQSGLNYWIGQMNKGMTRQQVFASFVNSQEFRNIVAGYGL